MTLWLLALIACFGNSSSEDTPVAGAALGPGSDRPVWMFRLNNGTWQRSAQPVAHSASSLGLGVRDGELILTMQCFWNDCGDEAKRHEIGPPVHALKTADLDRWTPAMWRLVDPDDRVPIDTELRGDTLLYYGTRSGATGDPAEHREAHTLYRADVVGDRLVNPQAVFSSSGAADPAPLTLGAETVLFVTTQPGRAIGLLRGTPLTLQREWTGVSVPHAMQVDNQIWVWAQTVREGRMIPIRIQSADSGQTWSDWDAPLPMDGLPEGCGNPVGAVFGGGPVVFCVTEPVGRPRP